MNSMKIGVLSAAVVMAAGLGAANAATLSGVVKSDAIQEINTTQFANSVKVACAPYEDNVSLRVNGSTVDVVLGAGQTYSLKAPLTADGHFAAKENVKGSGSVDGGLFLSNQPSLAVSGQINQQSGIAYGTVNIAPSNAKMVSCRGHFTAAVNNTASALPGKPFRVSYVISSLGARN